nr:putative TMEM70 family [Tanacetum cinerariifolium]
EQESEKSPSEILKIKKEQAEKQKTLKFPIKPTEKAALKDLPEMGRSILVHLVRSQTRHHLVSSKFHTGFHPRRFGIWQAQKTHSPAPYFNSAKYLPLVQNRWASQSAATDDSSKITIGPPKGVDSGKDDKDSGVVYYGPISNTIKKVKLLSLSTCCLSVSLGPVITFMTSPDMNVIIKGAVASSVIFLSASTTLALHWFVSPYIHKLRLPETNRPFVTFKANGEFYFEVILEADLGSRGVSVTSLEAEKKAMAEKMKAMEDQIFELSVNRQGEDDNDTGGSRVRSKGPAQWYSNDIKVEIPEYDGKLDPDEFVEWLRTVECAFDY